MKIKILKPFIGNVNGKSIPFSPNDIVEVNDKDAENMVKGGYAQAVNFVGVKVMHKPANKAKAVK